MSTTATPPVIDAELTLVVPESNLPPSLLTSIETGFKDAFAKAEEWRKKALAIKVTDASQTADMKMARIARLELKNIRVDADKTRKALKEDSLRMGNAIQGVYNLLLAAIVPLERHLEEQEQFGERLKEQQRQELIASRHDALRPYITEGQPLPPLDGFNDDQWTAFLADNKMLHEAKIAEAKRIEAERIAREKAEEAEREKIRQENERLRIEAEKRENEIAAERQRVEAERKAAEETARKERERLEAEARATEEKARKEREAAAERLRIAEEKARQEREAAEKRASEERAAIQAKAKAERDAAEAKARIEREAAAAKIREAEEARAKLEREAAEKAAQEEAARKEEEARKRKAARAPDKTKLASIAATVRAIALPELTTAEGKAVGLILSEQIEKFAQWIETQASKL